jgi:Uma2 family endonuclease
MVRATLPKSARLAFLRIPRRQVNMPTLILDPMVERQLSELRTSAGSSQHDEVWEGVTVVMPLPNIEHQRIVNFFLKVFNVLFDLEGPMICLPGANVSDRIAGWDQNYREPDVVVVREGENAQLCENHLYGAAELLIEIVSPGDRCRDKLPFYAGIGTREVLIVDRNPWQLELYQLRRGKLRLAGTVQPSDGKLLTSGVVPLAFALVRGRHRPKIRITHTQSGQEWMF